MFAKIFFAAVAQPNSEGLWNLLALVFVESFVESKRALTLAAAGFVVMCVPLAAREADSAVDLLDQSFAYEWFIFVLLRRHSISISQPVAETSRIL